MRLYRIKILFTALFFFLGFWVGTGWLFGRSFPTIWLPYFLQKNFAACDSIPMENIFEGSKRQRCYTEASVNIVRLYGMRTAVETVREYRANSHNTPLEGQRCHALAHEIGNAAARENTNAHTILVSCQNMCNQPSDTQSVEGLDLGCMNGAAHTWVLLSQNVETVADSCNDSQVPQEVREGCFHGIGHGLSELYGGDVIAEVNECKRLPTDRARYQCAHAVFMEKQALLTKNGLPVDPTLYCGSLPTEMSPSCYEFAGFIEYSSRRDVTRALATCRFVPDGMKSVCRERVGESLYLSRQKSGDVGFCEVAEGVEARDCILGFVRGSVDTVNDVYGNSALTSCGVLAQIYKNGCYGSVGQIVRDRYGDKKRQLSCTTIQNSIYQTACLSNESAL